MYECVCVGGGAADVPATAGVLVVRGHYSGPVCRCSPWHRLSGLISQPQLDFNSTDAPNLKKSNPGCTRQRSSSFPISLSFSFHTGSGSSAVGAWGIFFFFLFFLQNKPKKQSIQGGELRKVITSECTLLHAVSRTCDSSVRPCKALLRYRHVCCCCLHQ